MYITIAQELATRGFVVCSVYHNDGSSYLQLTHDIKIDDFEKRNIQVNIRASNLVSALDEMEKLGI